MRPRLVRSARLRGPARAARRGLGGFVTAIVLALASAGPARAQSIVVVANRTFRPTAVLGPHLRYVVATDSADGSALLRDVAIPPVVFAGSIRVEGVQPGARAPEPAPFADTVRFEPDGRPVLRLADAGGRPPISVQLVGARGAAAAKLVITAPQFPLGRAMLITISPADIYDLHRRAVGYGDRDDLQVDDRAGMAYLSDPGAGPTTVAIGFGRGAHGRMQADAAQLLVTRVFDGVPGTERRDVRALTLAIDPDRDASGTAHAEILFGLGNSAAEAAAAAQAVSDEPAFRPRASALRIVTPSDDIALLVPQILAASGWMLDWDVIDGQRTVPASAADPAVRAVDGWYGASLARQRGDAAAVCGTYYIVRPAGDPRVPSRVEVAPALGAQGRTILVSDSTSPDAEAAAILLAHKCFAISRDTALLRRAWPALAAAGARLTGASPDLAADALERLGDMDDALRSIEGSAHEPHGDSLRAVAAALPAGAPSPTNTEMWNAILDEARRGVHRDYGRPSGSGPGGLSAVAAGTFMDMVVGRLFGVREYLDRIEVRPHVDGIADGETWQLQGWLFGGGDTLGVSYRPADRRAVIRLVASQRRRVVLQFPWLTETSCVTARRGPDVEHLPLTMLADGGYYVDVRAFYDAAELTVSAAACAD